MITVLAITLVAAGVLLIMVAARMWSSKYYEATRRLAMVMPYSVALWTMSQWPGSPSRLSESELSCFCHES